MYIIVIADEVTGIGYRLAGAELITPDLLQLHEVLDSVMLSADMVLLSERYAELLSKQLINSYTGMVKPLFWVIPDIEDIAFPEPIIKEIQTGLGIATGE